MRAPRNCGTSKHTSLTSSSSTWVPTIFRRTEALQERVCGFVHTNFETIAPALWAGAHPLCLQLYHPCPSLRLFRSCLDRDERQRYPPVENNGRPFQCRNRLRCSVASQLQWTTQDGDGNHPDGINSYRLEIVRESGGMTNKM